MEVDWKELVVWFVGVTDWWELGWFVGVTVGVHAGVVSLLCAALALVERYKLFQEAKIQSKVFTLQPSRLDTLYCTTFHIYIYIHYYACTHTTHVHCIHTLYKHAHIQPVKVSQPKLQACLRQLAFLHFVLQPVGLPAFYALMKWRGMPFTAPYPSW